MVTIQRTDPTDPDLLSLVRKLDVYLNEIFGDLQADYDQYNSLQELDAVVIAYIGEQPIGCGCFKAFDEQRVEIKRMFVDPAHRGSGVANQIVDELEAWANEDGYTGAVLETGLRMPDAMRFYEKCGYQLINNYGQYAGNENSICFGKRL